jgi:hypothetical protein
VHGLYILSPTARAAWEILKEGLTLAQAGEIFAQAFGIPYEQAVEDVSRAWGEWSAGLLAKSSALEPSIVEQDSTPAADNGPESFVFSADYLVFEKVIRLRLYDADVAWDLTPRVEPFRMMSGGGAEQIRAADREIEVLAGDEAFQILVDGVPVSSETAVFATRVVVLQEMLKASSPQEWAAVLHAGACGSSTHCVLFPGASHSGKTTLAAALVNGGMTFYGDDSIPLTQETFRVQPMPFALMAREGSWPILSALFPGLEDAPVVDRWGEKVRYLTPPRSEERRSPSAAAIVFTRYSEGSATELQILSTFEALRRLRESGFWLEHDKVSIASFLGWLESISCYTLTYSKLDEAVCIVRSFIPKDDPPSINCCR